MKVSNYLLPFIMSFFLISSCSDFLVEDISDEKVNLRAPFNNAVLDESLTSFWWDTLQWVDDYTLEVVHPSYDSTEFISVLITQEDNIYDIELPGGEYQWSVVAHNSAYNAYSDTFNLTVVSDTIIDNIAPAIPELESPINGSLVSGEVVDLEWDSADDAVLNTLEIYNDSLLSEIILEINLSSESYPFTNLIYESYYWRVKSEDEVGNESEYSDVWGFSTN